MFFAKSLLGSVTRTFLKLFHSTVIDSFQQARLGRIYTQHTIEILVSPATKKIDTHSAKVDHIINWRVKLSMSGTIFASTLDRDLDNYIKVPDRFDNFLACRTCYFAGT